MMNRVSVVEPSVGWICKFVSKSGAVITGKLISKFASSYMVLADDGKQHIVLKDDKSFVAKPEHTEVTPTHRQLLKEYLATQTEADNTKAMMHLIHKGLSKEVAFATIFDKASAEAKEWPCPRCGKIVEIPDRPEHMRMHEQSKDKSDYTCRFCGASFDTNTKLISHTDEKHSEDSKQERDSAKERYSDKTEVIKVQKCPECGANNWEHNYNNTAHRCKNCNYIYDDTTGQSARMYSSRNDKAKSGSFSCALCGATVEDNDSAIVAHKKQKHDEKTVFDILPKHKSKAGNMDTHTFQLLSALIYDPDLQRGVTIDDLENNWNIGRSEIQRLASAGYLTISGGNVKVNSHAIDQVIQARNTSSYKSYTKDEDTKDYKACPECDYKAINQKLVDAHMQSTGHKNKATKEDSLSKKPLPNPNEEIEKPDVAKVGNAGSLECKWCDKTFETMTDRRNHYTKAHKQEYEDYLAAPMGSDKAKVPDVGTDEEDKEFWRKRHNEAVEPKDKDAWTSSDTGANNPTTKPYKKPFSDRNLENERINTRFQHDEDRKNKADVTDDMIQTREMDDSCPKCGKKFQNYNDQLKHLRDEHPYKGKSSSPGAMGCSHCHESFDDKEELFEHQRTMHKDKSVAGDIGDAVRDVAVEVGNEIAGKPVLHRLRPKAPKPAHKNDMYATYSRHVRPATKQETDDFLGQ